MTDFRKQPSGRFMLWVDAVGGFLVCLADEVVLGQPVGCGTVDVPILADISSRHACIHRDREGYLLEPIRDVRLDGRPLGKTASLHEGSRITLGESVCLRFRRPHALSATARLDLVSRHRTEPAADAVLLMADACILGPDPHSHVVCRDWPHEVILYRHGEELHCRTMGLRPGGAIEIDGHSCQGRGPITKSSRVEGKGFSLNLEEIGLD